MLIESIRIKIGNHFWIRKECAPLVLNIDLLIWNDLCIQKWFPRVPFFLPLLLLQEGAHCLKITPNVSFDFSNTVWSQASVFHKPFLVSLVTFLHSKCKCSSLRSQCWMRLFGDFKTFFFAEHRKMVTLTKETEN